MRVCCGCHGATVQRETLLQFHGEAISVAPNELKRGRRGAEAKRYQRKEGQRVGRGASNVN